jgi:hypothetical protein
VLNPLQFLTHTFSGVEGTRMTGAVTDFTSRLNNLFSMYNEQAENQDQKMVERLKDGADGVLHAVRDTFTFSRMSADIVIVE